MNHLHEPTLMLLTALLAATGMLVLALLLPRDETGSGRSWLLGLALLSLQWAVVTGAGGVFNLPHDGLDALGGALALLAMGCFTNSLWRLVGRPLQPLSLLGLAGLAGVAVAMVAIESAALRESVLHLAGAAMVLAGGAALTKPLADVPERMRALLLCAALISALSLAARASGALIGLGLVDAQAAAALYTGSLLTGQLGLVVAILGYVLVLRARAMARLRQRAELDSLTGVLNRATLHARLALPLDNPGKPGERVMVMLLDVLDLDAINRRAGYLAGDRVLQSLAKALRRGLPRGALVGRYSADQFLVAMRVGEPHGKVLAAQICRALEQEVGEAAIHMVSGVAEGPAGKSDLLRLASAAEIELREIKRGLRRAQARGQTAEGLA